MRIHLIKKQTIENYVRENAQSRAAFEIWFSIIRRADWSEPNQIIATFSTADILGKDSNRVVFNIGGNKYRMICKYHFGTNKAHLFVKWIGTHAEYDKICKDNNQFEIDEF